jgi:DNA end-binding protein Ku
MPPRATWKGHLKLSLVSFGVRVYNATTSSGRITLNQLHKDCHQRLKQKMVCPEHGDVDRDEIVKGYEFEKGRYVVVDEEDLQKVRLETTKTIDVVQFIDRDELKPIYLDAPYYLAPDGPVAEEAFRVIRTALEKSNKIGIGQFVLGGREHVVAIEVEGRGLRMTTLRSDAEVRSAEPYFEEIANGEVDGNQLKLAQQLIDASAEPLDTSRFRDRYQEALLAVIKAKVEGKEPAIVEEEHAPAGFSFMKALEESLAAAGTKKKKAPAASVRKTAQKSKKKKA